MNKKVLKGFLVFLFPVLLTACGNSYEISYEEESEPTVETVESVEEPVEEEASVYVAVNGEVYAPGVYILPEGARVYEVINAAGGFTENADETSLNLVEVVPDGSSIYVASKALGEVTKQESSGTSVAASLSSISNQNSGKININTASKTELMTLSGIGEAKASAIISYREIHGNFSSIEDIKNVSGIKEGTFENIKDKIAAY